MSSVRILLGATVMTAVLLVTAGCGSTRATARSSDPSSPSEAAPQLPPTTGNFDYQLGEAYAPARGVTVVTRDSTSKPAKGVYSICYVNGFQTQPGSHWPTSLILKTKSGTPLVDPGWPDEHIIDISTPAKRKTAAARIAKSTDLCASKGFAAVEFDNLDSYSRSEGALILSQAVLFAALLVKHAHSKGLASSQKNTGELDTQGKMQIGFDFATTEECDAYNECGLFTKVYGAHVLDVEYSDNLLGTFAQVCARKTTPPQTILRDRFLTTPSGTAYVYKTCRPGISSGEATQSWKQVENIAYKLNYAVASPYSGSRELGRTIRRQG